jgi:hypothetical protein
MGAPDFSRSSFTNPAPIFSLTVVISTPFVWFNLYSIQPQL